MIVMNRIEKENITLGVWDDDMMWSGLCVVDKTVDGAYGV
jgi:hypothetical protein